MSNTTFITVNTQGVLKILHLINKADNRESIAPSNKFGRNMNFRLKKSHHYVQPLKQNLKACLCYIKTHGNSCYILTKYFIKN
jgi:hypothetical protein